MPTRVQSQRTRASIASRKQMRPLPPPENPLEAQVRSLRELNLPPSVEAYNEALRNLKETENETR